MSVLGRNDICPCGSGIKYKKCCIDKAILKFEIQKKHIFLEDVQKLDTDTIISRLKYYGIDFDIEEFRMNTDNYYSAINLSDDWYQKYCVTAEGKEEDFIWISAWVLWNRLVEDKICDEETLQKILDGYERLKNKKITEGCDDWLEAWKNLKTRINDCGYTSLKELDISFPNDIYLSEWVDDMEMELHNAGLENKKYFKEQIKFTKEFVKLLPKSRPKTLKHLRRYEAEAHFSLGEIEKGEQKFKQLTKDYPDWAWGYIGWGDQYDFAGNDLIDKDKAKRIYQLALKEENNIDEEDIGYVEERIDNL